MESLAVAVWSNEKENRLRTLVQFTEINIGKKMNALYKKYAELKNYTIN